MELQGRVDELMQQGLGLVAISYDSVQTLAAFSASRGITFPLLSDGDSVIIKRYGLLNTTVAPGTRSHGIPFPGTFIVDRHGVVQSKHFEEAYQERNTVASLLVSRGVTPFGPATTVETRHLTMTAAISDDEVAPGERVSVVFDVTPQPGMHVYAPGKHSYQVVAPSFDPQPWLRVDAVEYPPSEIYHFKPLDERVEVYQKTFRLVQQITVLATPEAQQLLTPMKELTISGRLEYQACDDKLCYSPQVVPVRWVLRVRPLDRRPPG